MKQIWILLLCCLTNSLWAANEKHFVLRSPDGHLEVNVSVGEQVNYTLKQDGQLLLDKS